MFDLFYFFLYNNMITISNNNNSSDLLFSIPVHEKQDIVNNQIENIFNFNPNCKIILHINESFLSFDINLSNYKNLFFNKSNIKYNRGGDLLAFHISNFNYCINNNINFKFFIITASNELFIKKGSIDYIKKYKNGLQIVKNDNNDEWHNFNKNLQNNYIIKNLFQLINSNILCGGQTEGQFFEKNIFKNISDLYLKITNNNDYLLEFEAEEIIPATIFNTLNLEYNNPITLQNYSNNINFTINYIKNLINNNLKIEDKTIKNQLYSPHINLDSENIYSIKRVDRTFNKIRNYLTKNGIILNKEDYLLETYYYSNNSSIIINNNNNIIFNKKENGIKDFQWFGFYLKKGLYLMEFEYKTNNIINPYLNCGIKFHKPYEYIISHFLNNNFVNNEFQKISIPIINNFNQDIIFIFDNYFKTLDITFKNINFNNNYLTTNINKKNIIIILFKDNNNLINNYDNFNYYILNIFKNIYNIYIICVLNTNINCEKYILENYNPNLIYYSNNITFNLILRHFKSFINQYNINFDFSFIFNIDIILNKNISDLNIIFNKINFLSYTDNIDNYDLNYNICLIPQSFFNLFDKLINNDDYNNLKNELSINNIKYNLLINDFIYNNDLFKINNINNYLNYGFLLEDNYHLNLLYYNNHSYFKKLNNNHFYFLKNYTNQYKEFLWFGYFLKFSEETNININLNISFKIKIKIPIEISQNIGLKTHYPINFYNNFFINLNINEFKEFNFDINIFKRNQLIIFNFDNYNDEIELEIKNFKIIYKID